TAKGTIAAMLDETAAPGDPMAEAVDFVGPFEHHDVVVNGWRVPYLEATPRNGGQVLLCLDHRYGLELSLADAERIVPFIADCMAVAAGYTAHPGRDGLDEPRPRHPMARTHGV